MAQEKTRAFNSNSAVLFDDRTALHLTQAFHQEESLEELLTLAFQQLSALCHAVGLLYRHDGLQLQVEIGKIGHERHHAEYNLDINGRALGSLTLFFSRRQNDHEVQTCEDLLALMFTALNNAIRIIEIRGEERTLIAEDSTLTAEEKSDALILVALDGYPNMRDRDGDEWIQVLMSSVHSQIKSGLRHADGVYQIADELIAVLLPNTTMQQASEVAAKIRILVSSLHLSGSTDAQLTACMGISDARLAKTAEEVMANAKSALRQAQEDGVNTICAFDERMAAAAAGAQELAEA